jgi:hypothetical protein
MWCDIDQNRKHPNFISYIFAQTCKDVTYNSGQKEKFHLKDVQNAKRSNVNYILEFT